MARPLRIEFAGATYHLMSRGNARQAVFSDDADQQRFVDLLEDTTVRSGWELFGFVLMPNHFHLFLRTPRPNLSRGMQRLLSGYANAYAKRHRRPGHLFQSRFKGELIEDESYFWSVSRYVHLNPVRGKRPLVSHPRDWPWSSYPGYANRRKRLSWVAYDAVLQAWQGEFGGSDPAVAYRRYVEEGLASPPENPFSKAAHGWLLGGTDFVGKMRNRMKTPRFCDEVPMARSLIQLDVASVFAAVASHYDVDPAIFARRGNGHIARASAAWLARRLTQATLRELSVLLGLSRPESVSNLTRRIDRDLAKHSELRDDLRTIELGLLGKTKNKA
ncbi:MAG: transposase [Planctomycetes bacterium]|nr:transposase [Planctomycetota bacterium]